jgi:hypothetical protein
MPLVPVHHAHDNCAEYERAHKAHHKGRGYHVTAVLLILPALPSRHLHVALFTVCVWLGLEDSRNGLNKRLLRWRIRRCGCGAGGGMVVLVGVRVELDIVLRDGSILDLLSATDVWRVSTTFEIVTYRRSRSRWRVLVHWMVAKDVIVGWRRFLWGGRMSHLQLISCDKCVC